MIKFFLALLFTFLFFSCASSPKENAKAVLPSQTENTAEEIQPQKQEIEKTQESASEVSNEEIQPEKNSTDENPPEEKNQEEIKLEPIEDIQGYYESDPEPVFLEKQEGIEPIEETEEIPLVPPEEKIQEENSEPEKEESAPQEISSSENAAEEIQSEQTEIPAEEKTEVSENENSKTEIPNAENSEEIISQPEIQISETNIEENSAESNSQEEKTEPEKIPVIPSRSVSMKNSQYLDIVYPGKGWIYLGEEDGKNLMRYFGRKIGDKNTSFSLRSREEGKTILHFYKNDQLTGAFIDDYLEVEIKGKNFSAERILAPDYSSIVPPAQKNVNQEKISSPEISSQKNELSETSPKIPEEKKVDKKDSENENPATQNSAEISSSNEVVPSQEISSTSIEKNNSSDSSADELLKAAQENFNSKKYKDSLACLESFFEKADSRIDEGLFLQAQIFESNSSERNIKNALDNYETIVRRYPQSPVWKKASERVTYLKKFYFNIR
ncbi:hypothetical protein [uncultured Treponema sp.]|uniref:hypothetical protein n=1 Tax=uncultured Treponema sp. TaxID=162155 RepID=UPI0025FE8F09|nr:hypothetical protein [uncultured Treponema sp.]